MRGPGDHLEEDQALLLAAMPEGPVQAEGLGAGRQGGPRGRPRNRSALRRLEEEGVGKKLIDPVRELLRPDGTIDLERAAQFTVEGKIDKETYRELWRAEMARWQRYTERFGAEATELQLRRWAPRDRRVFVPIAR
jgi:hypothetical protein